MGTRGSFPGGKSAESWNWPLTSPKQKNVWIYTSTPSPNMTSWHGVQLQHKNFTFTFNLIGINGQRSESALNVIGLMQMLITVKWFIVIYIVRTALFDTVESISSFENKVRLGKVSCIPQLGVAVVFLAFLFLSREFRGSAYPD
jgi:hypothetical protein